MPLAHFTAAELPGTLAILIFGIVIGASVALRRTDSLTLAILGFSGLAALGSVLDHFQGVAAAWKTAADFAFLLAGLVLLIVLITRSPARGERARSR
jgi:ABC-type spermidine/putrescine transport system permease subunit I